MNRIVPTLQQAYSEALRRHAHELIAAGYERMDHISFADEQEPAITGELVREIRAYLEVFEDAPPWARYYSVHDDPPLAAEGRLGRHRRRVDIEFERVSAGKRPRLRFEAKRLSSPTGHSTGGYLGEDGLGCFLSGAYPSTHGEAGMLGYVQSGSEEDWVRKIHDRLSEEPEAFGIVPPPMDRQEIAAALRHTWVSRHRVGGRDETIMVHHVMLRFMA